MANCDKFALKLQGILWYGDVGEFFEEESITEINCQ